MITKATRVSLAWYARDNLDLHDIVDNVPPKWHKSWFNNKTSLRGGNMIGTVTGATHRCVTENGTVIGKVTRLHLSAGGISASQIQAHRRPMR